MKITLMTPNPKRKTFFFNRVSGLWTKINCTGHRFNIPIETQKCNKLSATDLEIGIESICPYKRLEIEGKTNSAQPDYPPTYWFP